MDRWAVSAYDVNDLSQQIKRLCSSEFFPQEFYHSVPGPQPGLQQGDIVELSSGVPVIWKDGTPTAIENINHWIVIGNTCDFNGIPRKVQFTQLAPLVSVDAQKLPVSIEDLKTYRASRTFYVPPWPNFGGSDGCIADLERIVSLHVDAVDNKHASRVASLSFQGWVLFHSCIVRFLARDDGRYE